MGYVPCVPERSTSNFPFSFFFFFYWLEESGKLKLFTKLNFNQMFSVDTVPSFLFLAHYPCVTWAIQVYVPLAFRDLRRDVRLIVIRHTTY